MPFVDSPGVATVQPIFGESGQPVQNTFHYLLPTGITVAELTALAHAYITWYLAHTGIFGAQLDISKVYARSLETATSPSLDVNPVASTTGTAPGNPLPNNATFAVKRQTGEAGRANRGRVYHPGLTAAMCSGNNTLLPGFAVDLVEAYDALRTAMIAAGATQEIIYHKATGDGTEVIGYAYTDLNLDSQRRRLPGHNIHH